MVLASSDGKSVVHLKNIERVATNQKQILHIMSDMDGIVKFLRPIIMNSIMSEQDRKSTGYLALLAVVILVFLAIFYLSLFYGIVPEFIINASDLISVIVSTILTYVIIVIYASIYDVEKSQKSINEEMRNFQEKQNEITNKQNEIMDKQTDIMSDQKSLINLNYKPILSIELDRIYEGELHLKLFNKGRGRAIEPHIRFDLTIGDQHSTEIMLDKDIEFSDRYIKIHSENTGKEMDESYLIPMFSRVAPPESNQNLGLTPTYVKTAIEPGDGGDYKAPVMMGISTESRPYYEGRGQKFGKWGKYLDNLASPTPTPDKSINWQISLLYRDEIGNIYGEDLLSGQVYSDYGIHVTGNEDDSILYVEGSEEEEEAVIPKKNLGDIISTLRDLPVGSNTRCNMDIKMEEIKTDYQEFSSE